MLLLTVDYPNNKMPYLLNKMIQMPSASNSFSSFCKATVETTTYYLNSSYSS